MGVVDYGETYSSDTFQIRDGSGALVDAGTVKVDITKPDLTTVTQFDAIHAGTGLYNFDYTPTPPVAGRHLFVVTATGGVLGSLIRKFVDAFVARPQNPALGIPFADAKAHLNEQSTLQDEEIRAYVEVATEIVEGLAGPIAVRSYTERVRNATWLFKLKNTPVTAVTSVTSIPTPTYTVSPSLLDVDGEYGIVQLLSGSWFSNAPYTVVYSAGRSNVPARHTHAIKEQLWHMWVTQRGQLADTTTPDLLDVADFESRAQPFGLGFLIPARVRELLETDLVPGVA